MLVYSSSCFGPVGIGTCFVFKCFRGAGLCGQYDGFSFKMISWGGPGNRVLLFPVNAFVAPGPVGIGAHPGRRYSLQMLSWGRVLWGRGRRFAFKCFRGAGSCGQADSFSFSNAFVGLAIGNGGAAFPASAFVSRVLWELGRRFAFKCFRGAGPVGSFFPFKCFRGGPVRIGAGFFLQMLS